MTPHEDGRRHQQGDRPRHGRWAAAVTTAVVVAALGAASGSTRDGDRSAAPPTVSASPAAQPTSVLPRTFVWWNDPAGFRVAVPPGWQRGRDAGGGLTFTAPERWPVLRITATAAPPRDVFAALVAEESRLRLASYRRVRIDVLPRAPDAVWEYTYQARSGSPMRCLRRLLTVAGRAYAVKWRAPRTAWARGLPALTVVLDSFGPAA